MSASNIRVGQLLRLTVRFADFNFSTGTDELFDPDDISLALYKYNTTDSTWDLVGALSPIIHDSVGIYYHDWLTPSDGKFKLIFTGTTPGATPSSMTNTRVFYVGTSTPTTVLTSDQNFYFLGELDPLYLDPEEIARIYPLIDYVDITESIYKVGLQIREWFGDGVVVTSQIRDYIIAAVLCDLSKTYFLEGGMFGFNGGGFTLGDLTINGAQAGSINKNNVYEGNAPDWCSLALVLKNNLFRGKLTFSPIVKGSNFDNPIPSRQLRNFD